MLLQSNEWRVKHGQRRCRELVPMRYHRSKGKEINKISGMEDFVQENKVAIFLRCLMETGLTEQYDLEAKSFEFTETGTKMHRENGEYIETSASL